MNAHDPKLRQPPAEIDIEAAVLGAMLVDNRLIDVAAAELEPEHFFETLHQRIFQLIVHLSTEGQVTPLILRSVMKIDPGLAEIGHDYLLNLAEAAPALPNIPSLARIIREAASRRELLQIADDLASEVLGGEAGASAQSIADKSTEALLRLGVCDPKQALTPFEIAMESLKNVDRLAKRETPQVVPTGFAKLDHHLGGLMGDDLIVIAGKSSMGKSAVMCSMSLRAALAGIPTLVFSLEMTRNQWVERCVCDLDFDENAEKPMFYSKVRNGRLSEDEFSRFYQAMQALVGLPFEIVDIRTLTVAQMGVRARAFKAKHGGKLGAVFGDYLQIIEPSVTSDRSRNREQAVGEIAKDLKTLAKILGWPVVVGSQLNDDDSRRADKEQRPRPSDLRESKRIFHEADIMLAPYRPVVSIINRREEGWQADVAQHKDRHLMQLGCIKNRHGAPFDIDLWCNMGANAVRDEEPVATQLGLAQAADLLALAGV